MDNQYSIKKNAMIISLDHNQRLNLVTMLDAIENIGRRETWAVCALQQKLDLSDEERQAIGWRKVRAEDGREFIMWNRSGDGVAPREYDLPEDDMRRLCNAVDRYPVVLGRDKHWWLPLTAQLPKPAETNGDKL